MLLTRQELAKLTENIDKIQHTTLKPLIEKNHQLTAQRASSLCKIIQ